MRAATAYQQDIKRQRLSFARCRKCGRLVAVFGLAGQDVTNLLYENGFRLASLIGTEIEMECRCCYVINVPPDIGPDLSTMADFQRQYNKLLLENFRW